MKKGNICNYIPNIKALTKVLIEKKENKKPLKTVRPDCRQFDIENRQTKVKVKVTIEIKRTCYWLPSGKVSSL